MCGMFEGSPSLEHSNIRPSFCSVGLRSATAVKTSKKLACNLKVERVEKDDSNINFPCKFILVAVEEILTLYLHFLATLFHGILFREG